MKSFYDSSSESTEAKKAAIKCPEKFSCTKLLGQSENVCCPIQEDSIAAAAQPEPEIYDRPQSSEFKSFIRA